MKKNLLFSAILINLFSINGAPQGETKEMIETKQANNIPLHQAKIPSIVVEKKVESKTPTPIAEIKPSKQPSVIPVVKKEELQKPKDRPILVKNCITKDDITYTKHWSGNHTPTTFIVKINGQEITKQPKKKPGRKKIAQDTCEKLIQLADNKMDIELHYEFRAMGISYRKDTKLYTCVVPDSAQKIEANFSWDNESRLIFQTGNEKKEELKLVCIQ